MYNRKTSKSVIEIQAKIIRKGIFVFIPRYRPSHNLFYSSHMMYNEEAKPATYSFFIAKRESTIYIHTILILFHTQYLESDEETCL